MAAGTRSVSMPIYTRTGDNGQTSLSNGQRVSKADLRVEAYGTIDELNSVIGVAVAQIQKSKVKSELVRIQSDLFEIGSRLANLEVSSQELAVNNLPKKVKEFENEIDEMTEEMPALSNFILPGGGRTGALLHFARTVCRRAERKVVTLDETEKVGKDIIIYLNRLSDLLFTMARFANYRENYKEILWLKGKSK